MWRKFSNFSTMQTDSDSISKVFIQFVYELSVRCDKFRNSRKMNKGVREAKILKKNRAPTNAKSECNLIFGISDYNNPYFRQILLCFKWNQSCLFGFLISLTVEWIEQISYLFLDSNSGSQIFWNNVREEGSEFQIEF